LFGKIIIEQCVTSDQQFDPLRITVCCGCCNE